jgi:chromosomal replication initiation ATPase DnaA
MTQGALPFDWPPHADERDFIVTDANRLAVRHLEHWSLWPVMATILTGPRKSQGTLIDNAERADEEAIFHAWNRAQEERRPLLVVADAAPPAWKVRLLDLRSRLAATPHIDIAEPDDALAAALIEKLVVARGLAPPPDLARYLLPRIERSYLGIHRIVEALDEAALQRRSRITLPIARAALASLGVIDPS